MADIGNTMQYFGADPNAPTQFGKAASIGQLRNFGINTGAGSATYTPEGLNVSGPGTDVYNQALGVAGGSFGNAGGWQSFGQGSQDLISQLYANGGQSPQSTMANSLFSNFGTQLGNFDVNNAAGSYTDILNRLALPKEQQAANNLGDRLFSMGRLGGNDTTAGRAFGELSQAQAAAQDQRSLSAYQLANQQFNTLANATNTFGGLGSTLTTNNIANFGRMAALPGVLQGQDVQNASGAISAGNAALAPQDSMVARLFQGANLSAEQKQSISNALAAKLAANKANGKNAGWSGALSGGLSGAMAGFQAGGPWGALAGGIAGGAGGYFSQAPQAGQSSGGGAGPAAMGGGLASLFSMFGNNSSPPPAQSYNYGGGYGYPASVEAGAGGNMTLDYSSLASFGM